MMVCEQHKRIQYSLKILLVQYVTVLIAVSLMKKKKKKTEEKDERGVFKKEGKVVVTAGRDCQQSSAPTA